MSKLVYMDESGTPGIAINANDWLVVGIVIFSGPISASKLSDKIDLLRKKLSLPENYEFHRIKDKPTVRENFEKVIFKGDLEICTVAIRKNQFSKLKGIPNARAPLSLLSKPSTIQKKESPKAFLVAPGTGYDVISSA